MSKLKKKKKPSRNGGGGNTGGGGGSGTGGIPKWLEYFVNPPSPGDILIDALDKEVNKPVPPKAPKVPDCPPTPTVTKPNISNNFNTTLNNTFNYTRTSETNIYNTTNTTTINITIPPLPTRNLPQELTGSGSTNTQFTYTSKVKKSLANRRWGRLITRPFYDEPQTICVGTNLTPAEFFANIMSDISTYEYVRLEEDEVIDALHSAVAFMSLGDNGFAVPVPSLEIINKISSYYGSMSQVSGFDVTGLINLGEITVEDCGYSPDVPDYPFSYIDFCGDKDDPYFECAQPLIMFPDRTGYKPPQIQVTWRNVDWAPDNRYPKVTTFPHPKDPTTLTAQNIKGVLPATYTFGKKMFKFNFVYKGKVNEGGESGNLKAFGEAIVFADSDDFPDEYVNWVEGMCDTSLIELNENRPYTKIDYGNNSLQIHTGVYKPYRAVYMEWDRDRKKWRPLYHWRLDK